MLPDAVRSRFRRRDDLSDWKSHASALAKHRKLTINSLPLFHPTEVSPPEHLSNLLGVLFQVLNSRAKDLHEGALTGATFDMPNSLASCARAHVETTAALGFAYNRCTAQEKGNIQFDDLHKIIAKMLIGTRWKEWLEKSVDGIEEMLTANNIEKLLAYSDKSLSVDLKLFDSDENPGILKDCHYWLSEFSHPNFHSLKLSYSLDIEKKTFRFKPRNLKQNDDGGILNHLQISSDLFFSFAAEFPNQVDRIRESDKSD